MGLFTRRNARARDFENWLKQLKVHDQVRSLLREPRAQERGRLLPHGFKVYSQNDEDGIIQEIFARIGTTNRFFVEFGVEGGLENNSLYLLLQGWKGLWLEGSDKWVEAIHQQFRSKIETGDLRVQEAFVGPENFTQLLTDAKVPTEFDFLSIDIDGNDYHVYSALTRFSPRVVAIEYNAKMRPPLKWVMKYNPEHRWDGTDYFGASLKSFELLFAQKGYALVGCNLSGVNAFFVRRDLLGDLFCAPFTAENHYEPARYFLSAGFVSGHAANFGPYESWPAGSI